MDNHPIVGFDLDGVLIDHTESKIVVAKVFGFDITPQQTPSEVLRQLVPYDTLQQMQRMLYDDPQYAYLSPLMDGVETIIQMISVLANVN